MIENYDEFEKKLVWIFGTPRSGSTWLARDILKSDKICLQMEPLIGAQLAAFRSTPNTYWKIFRGRHKVRLHRIIDQNRDDIFFSPKYESSWKPALRHLILNRFMTQHPLKMKDYLVIKSPNESHGSDIIMKSLPNSRLIFLIRDGRDVIDSLQGKFFNPRSQEEAETPEERRFKIIYHAMNWNIMIETTTKAFELHDESLRLLIKYEDLRLKTEKEIKKIYRFLGYELDNEVIKQITDRTSFENVPHELRGEEKVIRKAQPEGYKEYFSDDELQMVNSILGDNLKKFGYQ